VTRLVLLGGGHAHVLVLLKLRNFVSKNLAVSLVTPSPVHVYSGMVPGVVAGHYSAADARIDLARLAARAGVELVLGSVRLLDAAAKQVVLASGESISYDVASLNLGSSANSVKPFEKFIAHWREMLQKPPDAPRVAVLGAGAGGVELAMAMKFALDQRGKGGSVELFTDQLVFPPAVAARIRRALDERSIPLHLGTALPAEFDATFRVTGATANPLLRESGLKTDARGYVLVDAGLRSVSHPDVFAAGDNASLLGHDVPKSGVYAVRQGAVLAENLTRVVRGMPMLDYVPQESSLSLISCGAKYAIASRGGWSTEGKWVWRWKDWVDRRWVAKFR
jgi:pyridine nucleotide-disulfide oxidoreductase family protein